MTLLGRGLFYRFQQLMILVLHLVYLKWILYVLNESNQMTTEIVFSHFFGMAIFGGFLIFGCAKWAKFHHLKEINQNNLIHQSKGQSN